MDTSWPTSQHGQFGRFNNVSGYCCDMTVGVLARGKNNTNSSNTNIVNIVRQRCSSDDADQRNARTAAMRRSTAAAAAAAAAARRRRPKELRELGRTPRVPLSQGSNSSYGGHRHSVSVVQWCAQAVQASTLYCLESCKSFSFLQSMKDRAAPSSYVFNAGIRRSPSPSVRVRVSYGL